MLDPHAVHLSSVKEEGLTEPTFTDRFIYVLENLEVDPTIPKDSIFQWIKLFHQNNTLFKSLFERTFLLIFQNHTNLNTHKLSSLEVLKGYSNLLEGFLNNLSNSEFQVKSHDEKKDFFENFLDFQLQFFGEGLTAGKFFIKEFSFQMVTISLKILDKKLDIQLKLNTQNQLLNSAFYLLTLKNEENKKTGIQLYAMLRKLDIRSDDINELLLEYLEELQNYNLRKLMIRWGIQLKDDEILDRFLNRLKDKNPLIIEEVIQKLITEEIDFKDMKFEQKIKLIVDGYGSPHQKVKEKMIQYLERDLLEILNSNQEAQVNASRIEQKEVILQTLNKSMSLSSNRSRNFSNIEEIKKWTKIQKLIRIFNYDESNTSSSDIFRENPFISSLICEIIFEVSCSCLQFKEILKEVQQIFHQIELYTIKSEDCIFLYSLLQGIHENKTLEKNETIKTKKELKEYICRSNQMPSIQILMASLTKLFEDKDSQNLTTKYYLLKIIELLAVKFDLFDCVGKRFIYEQLQKILSNFGFFDGYFKDNHNKENIKQNENFRYLQLMKASQLINVQSSAKNIHLQVVTGQTDLIFQLTDLIHFLIRTQPSCEPGQFKALIDQLFESKHLKLEKDTMINIYMKTTDDLKNMQDLDIETIDSRSFSHLSQIKHEIEKKLKENQRKIISNTLKGFFILVKTLSIKEKLQKASYTHLAQIKASNYIENVKNFIYNVSDGLKIERDGELQICWVPYLLFYHYISENIENLMVFKKLFVYYAFGQQHSLCQKDSLLKLLSTRILIELEMKFLERKENAEITQNEPSVLNRILENLMSCNLNDPGEQYFYQQFVLRNFETIEQKDPSLSYKLFLFALKEYLEENSDGIYSRIFLLIFRKTSLKDPKATFNAIMQVYYLLAQLINDQKAVLKNEQKQILMWHGTKIIKNLLSFYEQEGSKEDSLTNDLMQMSLTLKILEIVPQQTFPPFSSYQLIRNASNFQQIEIEVLIFIKGQIQNSLEKLQVRPIQKHIQIQNEFFDLQESLEVIEEKIREEISSRLLKQGQSIHYEQQSTNHSPLLSNQSQPEKNKINFDLIDFYKSQLETKINQFKIATDKISESVINTNFYKSLCTDFAVFVGKYKIAHSGGQKVKIQQIKIEEEKIVQLQSAPNESAQTNPISVEFDRMGKRKLSRLDKQKRNIMMMNGSVRRSKYVVIPYDIVETAQEKYERNTKGRAKGNKSRTGRRREEKDKTYRLSLNSKQRRLFRQQLSSRQTSSQPESQCPEESQPNFV